MELTLNLGWACGSLDAVPGREWRRARIRPPHPIVALAVVILILLPAISMTDDLMAAQNPAEIDCCVRRDHDSPAAFDCSCGRRASDAGIRRVIDRICAHGRARQSFRALRGPSRPGLDSEPSSSGRLISFPLVLHHSHFSFPVSAVQTTAQRLCMKRIFTSLSVWTMAVIFVLAETIFRPSRALPGIR